MAQREIATPAAAPCSCGCAHDRLRDAQAANGDDGLGVWDNRRVAVVHDRRSSLVYLDRQTPRLVGGAPAIRLFDIVSAPGPTIPMALSGATFDFVGEDGFRTASRPSSQRVAITATHLLHGYVTLANRALVWDASLTIPCVYRVKRLIAILVG